MRKAPPSSDWLGLDCSPLVPDEFAEFRPEFRGKRVLLVNIPRQWGNTIRGEAANRLAQQLQLFTMAKIEFKHEQVPFCRL